MSNRVEGGPNMSKARLIGHPKRLEIAGLRDALAETLEPAEMRLVDALISTFYLQAGGAPAEPSRETEWSRSIAPAAEWEAMEKVCYDRWAEISDAGSPDTLAEVLMEAGLRAIDGVRSAPPTAKVVSRTRAEPNVILPDDMRGLGDGRRLTEALKEIVACCDSSPSPLTGWHAGEMAKIAREALRSLGGGSGQPTEGD